MDTPEAVLASLGDGIDARPTFAEMFSKADDKVEFLKEVKPYMYVGTFLVSDQLSVAVGPLSRSPTCAACQHLHTQLQCIKQ